MTINSRAKGCRGEREFAAYLRDRGIAARRGQQFSGGGESPDVIHDLPGIHFEVKRVEAGSPYGWLEQATKDGVGKVPVVAHKRNGKDWIAILPMSDFIALVKL
jgi:Holliday junction resolvase